MKSEAGIQPKALQIIMSLKIQFVYMTGVKQLVSLMAERLSEEFFICLLDFGILVGETKLSLAVKPIQLLSAASGQFTAVMDGLAAAAHTAAGARHNLQEVIVYFPLYNILHQLLRIPQSADGTGM